MKSGRQKRAEIEAHRAEKREKGAPGRKTGRRAAPPRSLRGGAGARRSRGQQGRARADGELRLPRFSAPRHVSADPIRLQILRQGGSLDAASAEMVVRNRQRRSVLRPLDVPTLPRHRAPPQGRGATGASRRGRAEAERKGRLSPTMSGNKQRPSCPRLSRASTSPRFRHGLIVAFAGCGRLCPNRKTT